MNVVYFLLPVAMLMSASGLYFFFWALRSGQYEDFEGPRWRILYDDDSHPAQPPEAPGRPAEGAQ
jgi:cbb3-type cytochrome oxidase maturation protein